MNGPIAPSQQAPVKERTNPLTPRQQMEKFYSRPEEAPKGNMFQKILDAYSKGNDYYDGVKNLNQVLQRKNEHLTMLSNLGSLAKTTADRVRVKRLRDVLKSQERAALTRVGGMPK